MPDNTEERKARYRAGLCITCGVNPHSAGRPRCDDCHSKHVTAYEPGLQRRNQEGKRGA
jgi:primosomal protein N'